MCTLIFGWQVAGEGTLVLAANRDEDPLRPSETPRVLRGEPRIVGGRDVRAGGTWLALRGGRCVVGVLNRRPRGETLAPARRPPSRGLLAIAVAAAGDGDPRASTEAARLLLAADDYAPCSLVIAGPEAALVVHHRGPGRTERVSASAGWHVITHEDLDDPAEPRTAWLARELDGYRPGSVEEAWSRLGGLLGRHDEPAVCLHEGRMVTVSTARIAMTPAATRYWHGEGLACRATLVDYSALLDES